MVVIRLARGGSKKRPFYRMVVADKRMPRDGRFIEQVGFYDPRSELETSRIKLDRVDYWLSKGAQFSDTAKQVVKKYRKTQEVSA